MNTSSKKTLWKRGGGFQKIHASCGHILSQMFQTKDFLYSKILQDWHGIVGPELADATRPQRIHVFKNEGILYIDVDASGSLWVPAHSTALIERVNQYMGYKAIHRITFRRSVFTPLQQDQKNGAMKSYNPDIHTISETFEHELIVEYPILKTVSDPRLNQALVALAHNMKILEEKD